MLITKYLTAVSASIDPFTRTSSKSARLFLALLVKEGTRRDANPKITTKILPRLSSSTSSSSSAADAGVGAGAESGRIEVTYKDGKKATFSSQGQTIAQLVELVNRHSKAIALKEQAA